MHETNNLSEVLTAKELQSYLHISRAGVYNLLNRADFPTLHIGKRKLVARQQLERWIENNSGKITL